MMAAVADLDGTLARYAVGSFDDTTPLAEAGLESLAILRITAELAGDPDHEIDAERLVALRTVGELKSWLIDLLATDSGSTSGSAQGSAQGAAW